MTRPIVVAGRRTDWAQQHRGLDRIMRTPDAHECLGSRACQPSPPRPARPL